MIASRLRQMTAHPDLRRFVAAIDLPALAGIVALYGVSRLLLMIVAMMTIAAIDPTVPDRLGPALAQVWCRWDCGWYLAIAEHGYSIESDARQPGATRMAFFPLWPLLIRTVSDLTGMGLLGTGIALANLAFLAALAYVHRYALMLGYSRSTAMLSVALLCFIPQGFVFSAVYTESLFLLLLVAAMFHMHRGQYLRAGIAAALISAVRSNGVVLLVFLLAVIVRRHGPVLLAMPWRRPQVFIPVLLAPLGLFAYWAYSFHLTGDAFAQASSIAHGWGWRGHLFLDNLASHLGSQDYLTRFWLVSSLVAAALSLLLLRLRLYEEFVFCAAMLLLLWSGSIPNSLLRYVLVLFPIWIALARHLEPRPVASAAVVGGFALINGFLMTAWTLGALITI